jgi:hypothetical protein
MKLPLSKTAAKLVAFKENRAASKKRKIEERNELKDTYGLKLSASTHLVLYKSQYGPRTKNRLSLASNGRTEGKKAKGRKGIINGNVEDTRLPENERAKVIARPLFQFLALAPSAMLLFRTLTSCNEWKFLSSRLYVSTVLSTNLNSRSLCAVLTV